MKKKALVVVAALSVGAAGLYLPACGDTSCGPGTTLVDDVCVASTADFSASMDLAGSATNCGPKTKLNTTTNTCEIDPMGGVCPQGYTLDTTNFNCIAPSLGTQIFSAGMTQFWSQIARVNPAPTDGGGMYQALGGGTGGVSVMGVPDDTLLFMSKAPNSPMGGVGTGYGTLPVFWQEGPPSTVPTYADHQFTFGEWKKCKATFAFYKDPPVPAAAGKKWYKQVVDVAGCPPGVLFSVWNVFSNTDSAADRKVSMPVGGLPEALVTDSMGAGHFERDLDPEVWFKAGISANGVAHGSTVQQTIPDPATFPNASVIPNLIYQNQGQTNGNTGWCEKDPMMHIIDTNVVAANTICTQTASNKIFLAFQPGVSGANTHGAIIPPAGQEDYCSVAGNCKPIPISMLQPY
jgi:hypothetical protein